MRDLLSRFLATRRCAAAAGDGVRREEIRARYAGAPVALPPALAGILDWANRHSARLDLLLLWGSYVRGDESERSFSFAHADTAHPGSLLWGPSDLDGLVVSAERLHLPRLMAPYQVLDTTLRSRARVSLDLYRDVIQVRLPRLRPTLAGLVQRHRSCIVDAFVRSGVVLHASPEVREVFRSLSGETDHARVCEVAMAQRFARFAELPRPGPAGGDTLAPPRDHDGMNTVSR